MTETIARHRALTGRKTGREPGQRRAPRFWWQTSKIEGHRFERGKGPWFRQYGSTKRAGLKVDLDADAGLNISGAARHRGFHLGWMPTRRWTLVRGGFTVTLQIGDQS